MTMDIFETLGVSSATNNSSAASHEYYSSTFTWYVGKGWLLFATLTSHAAGFKRSIGALRRYTVLVVIVLIDSLAMGIGAYLTESIGW